MNNNTLTEEVTILTTWDNEIININYSIEEWLTAKSNSKSSWEDWIYLKSLKRFLKFSAIKDEQWKTKYMVLEAPKKKPKELTPEERKKRDIMIKEMLEKTFEWRKKRFYDRREEILNDLEKEEKNFWMETTKSKIQNYLLLKNKIWKNV